MEHKLLKYIHKLSKSDVASDKFSLYLGKLNYWYIQYGGVKLSEEDINSITKAINDYKYTEPENFIGCKTFSADKEKQMKCANGTCKKIIKSILGICKHNLNPKNANKLKPNPNPEICKIPFDNDYEPYEFCYGQ